MIIIQNANDFEFFSSNSAGAIQGNGYECRNNGYVNSVALLLARTSVLCTRHGFTALALSVW